MEFEVGRSITGDGMISVLFIDDEPALLEITRLFLERSGELKVETCRSALDALEILKSRSFDAIVSDYEMPMMDGIVLLKILRAEGDNTPFIIFTGKGREHVVVDALNNRADFYLSKGQDPKAQFSELDRMIRQAINRRIAEESLRVADRRMVDIINHLPDATFAIDREGTVISWNKAMEDLTGIPAADVIGKGNYEYSIPFYGTRRPLLVDLIGRPEEEIRALSYQNIRRDGNSLVAENPSGMRNGKPAVFWSRATLITDRKGNVIGAIESIRDITDIRKAEREQKAEAAREKQTGMFDRIFGKSTASWYKKGVDLYYKQGKFLEAVSCFDRVIEMDPTHVNAWTEKGICLKELGRYDEAVQCFNRALELNGRTPSTYYALGETMEKLGKETGDISLFEKAVACFDRVLEMEPDNVNAWNYRGVCLKELGKFEEARRSFDKAQMILRVSPDKAHR
ncbi:MAG TPA: tetratricopeptide repeat protein [Methanolinea sp.]|nr:tetratricopeptide repeat protein [Methanolinea sp.]HQK56145.1 tetratricopeptide repeat protein [Methanolinea sp.]